MLSRKNKLFLKKLLSLFSVVRGYNVWVVILAQYLSSLFILSQEDSFKTVVLDFNLFLLVLATSLAIASGYIINNFYDSEKDLINRPKKSMLDRLVSQQTKLTTYFILNISTVFLASYVSFRAVVFFTVYIFMIWFYSHKLKKYLFVGNITASLLTIAPFFIVFVYYKNFALVVFFHGLYLMLLISIRELTKDLENIKGDLVLRYQTLPVVYGIKAAKRIISFLVLLTFVTCFVMLEWFYLGKMDYYFYLSMLLIGYYIVFLWKANRKSQYVFLHNLLKLILVVGAFSIILLQPEALVQGIEFLINLVSNSLKAFN